jgi:hypothetical protein
VVSFQRQNQVSYFFAKDSILALEAVQVGGLIGRLAADYVLAKEDADAGFGHAFFLSCRFVLLLVAVVGIFLSQSEEKSQ